MKERQVKFKDKQGRQIIGDMIRVDSDSNHPVVIVCHGFKGNRNEKHIKAIAEKISEKGITTLRFDFTKNPGESSLPFEDMTVSYELEVLDQAVEFVKSLEGVDQEKIGIVGHSLGGLVVGWYASTHPTIAVVVSLSGVYSFLGLLERHHSGAGITASLKKEAEDKGFVQVYSNTLKRNLKIKKTFFEDAIKYEMDSVVASITCPIMTVHGTSDESVPLSHSQYFLERSKSKIKELKIIAKADHVYSSEKTLNNVKNSVADWLEKILL